MRPLCTALALITSQFNVYSEGDLAPNKAYPYLAMATNLSQVPHHYDACTTHTHTLCVATLHLTQSQHNSNARALLLQRAPFP